MKDNVKAPTQQQSLEPAASTFEEQRQLSSVSTDTSGPSDCSQEKGLSSISSLQAVMPNSKSHEKSPVRSTSIDAAPPTHAVGSLEITTNGGVQSTDGFSTMPTRSLRKRKEPPIFASDPVTEALRPLTDEERQNWKGWVELESDPAIFNHILRRWGIQDVKVQEVFGLDDTCMSFVLKPIYGMIFLFRYHDDDAEAHDDAQKCPKHVWFANQTTTNACATIALLNIVMNVPGLDLGENLQAFKETTQQLKPPYRGKRLGDNAFIRGIHNSFARRMDILNADLLLKNEYDDWVKTNRNAPKKAPAVKKKQTKKKWKKKKMNDEPGYHFIAYVPIQGEVWRLDGLQREPVKLGDCGNDWIDVAKANIMQRALQYQDDGVEYSLMSLCKSPTRLAIEGMASNLHLIQAVERALSELIPDWRVFMEAGTATTIEDTSTMCKVTRDLVDRVAPSASERAKLDAAVNDPTKLQDLYNKLVKEQDGLKNIYLEEVGMVGQEDEQALKKKIDHTATLYRAMQALAEAGVLGDIVNDVQRAGG
ncbi:related to 26S proteasome-associated ubiquitin carboxyl-terminal hydrolase [Rhynchosporium agropyri]|uniref:Ubiquitin carboxyl-terminal hydrolase n=1 Tax=Rhynchosporium agropyri TaxID=914238 RepID=A0A1E1KAF1_9HELO|nr:related to 26S proteasome-associated ubiquitin carboxyl-terminal hydrolase [Rhynchosporium agropyri]